MKIIVSKIFLMLFIITIIADTVAAQTNAEVKPDATGIKLPLLNNHKFVVNPYVSSPFITTFFRNTLGAGQAVDLYVPVVIIDGKPVAGLRGTVTFLTLEFEYQAAVNNWLAVFGKVGMLSRFGSEPQALISQGVNATYGFELGWLIKVMETKKVTLSATINLWNKSGTTINFYDFIKDIIDNGELRPENQLVFSKDYIQGGGGLRAAWTPNKFIGVNGLVEFALGESLKNNGTKIFYNFAGSADFDLKTISSIPVGFATGFVINTFLSSGDTSIDSYASNLFLRTAYTGRDDMLISLDLTYNKIPVKYSVDPLKGTTVNLSLEYFF
jgi:hypothetical protein